MVQRFGGKCAVEATTRIRLRNSEAKSEPFVRHVQNELAVSLVGLT
jgi:hypothetical protein